MLKYLYLIAALFGTIQVVQCQSFNWEDRAVKHDTDLLKTTTWIVAYNDLSNFELGTGYYFYSIERKKLYLITNKHIVNGYKYLTFGISTMSGRSNRFTMDSLQSRYLRFKADTAIDLVAINLSSIPYLKLTDCPYIKVFTEKNLISQSEIKNLSPFSEQLVCLSYPGVTEIPPPLVPYIFHCSFATIYSEHFSNRPEFAVEGNLSSGSSGSPVIRIKSTDHGIEYSLLGTYFFEFSNYNNIDTTKLVYYKQFLNIGVPTGTSIAKDIMVNEDMHIGLAIKSSELVDLIDKK